MSGDITVMALVTVEDGETTIVLGPCDDDDFEGGIEVVVPEEAITDDGGWKWDPFGDLHDSDECRDAEMSAAEDSLSTLRDIVVREHDEKHEAPRLWCTDPVCRHFFGINAP